jgi:hypothetical protein
MLIRGWRLGTVMLIALSMGLALSHLLEMPAKMGYDSSMWLTLSHTLYSKFGTYGSVFEVGALLSSVALVFLARKRGPSFPWTLTSAMLVALAHVLFWVRVAPVNAETAIMTPDALPADWQALRAQWEYGHAMRAVLQICALAAVTMSILVETPTDVTRRR